MRGRTNVTGNGEGGLNLGADVQEFVVANGSNITAGNFVQFRLQDHNAKYDTNYNFDDFYDSKNGAPKVFPCGNNRFVMRYNNAGQEEVYWFNLIDVGNGFQVISSFNIFSAYIPSFYLLNDGNFAICYMEKQNVFTVRIYDIKNTFSLLETYELSDENIGSISVTHITQLGNGKIIINKYNSCIVCDYENGAIGSYVYINLGLSYTDQTYKYSAYIHGDNDWNLYAVGDNEFIIFPSFRYTYVQSSRYSAAYFVYLIKIENGEVEILDSLSLRTVSGNSGSFYLNCALWGNGFGINGKILFSDGFPVVPYDSTHMSDLCMTRIYYKSGSNISQTTYLDLIQLAKEVFPINATDKASLNNSSGTAQYVKENVFYVSILPRYGFGSKTAIFRVEYNPNTGMFSQSNIITFEGGDGTYRFGFGKFFESDEGDVYYLYETSSDESDQKKGRWLLSLTYTNGVLSLGENTKYVENYSGNAPIGVAKESGKSGETIEVYVPTPV